MASAQQSRLLHLGCGLTTPSEWLNVDGSSNAWLAKHPFLRRMVGVLRLAPKSQLDIPWSRDVFIADLRRPLPFPDGSFDAVYSSHLIEHLHRNAAIRLLKEAHRVLSPGGRCRTLAPDLRAIVEEYLGQRRMAEQPADGDADPAKRMCSRMLMHSQNEPPTRGLFSKHRAGRDFHSHKWMYDGPSLLRLMQEAGFADCRICGFRESGIPHIDKVESPGRVLDGQGVIVEGIKR